MYCSCVKSTRPFEDKIVCVWSFPDGELLGSYKGHNGAVLLAEKHLNAWHICWGYLEDLYKNRWKPFPFKAFSGGHTGTFVKSIQIGAVLLPGLVLQCNFRFQVRAEGYRWPMVLIGEWYTCWNTCHPHRYKSWATCILMIYYIYILYREIPEKDQIPIWSNRSHLQDSRHGDLILAVGLSFSIIQK